jgi:hypothetical protein
VTQTGEGKVAFVLGGGGVLGATQVGMLRALVEQGITPDLVLGTSVGALNGAVIAADPSQRAVSRLTDLWSTLSDAGVFSSSLVSQAARLARYGTHLHSAAPLRRLLEEQLPVDRPVHDRPMRISWWLHAAGRVPREEAAVEEWLRRQWDEVDARVLELRRYDEPPELSARVADELG